MGRPPLPEGERRSEVLQLRLTRDERAGLEAGAEAAGQVLSDFIRTSALERAKALLGRLGRRS